VSLVEILVSVFLFGLCLVPVFSVFGKMTDQSRFNRDTILGMQLAVELVDQVSGMPFQAVPLLAARPLSNRENGILLQRGRPETMLVLSPLPPGFERFLTVAAASPRTRLVRGVVTWGTMPKHESRWEALMEWSP